MPTLTRRLWLLLRLEAGLGSRQHQDGLRLCIRGALARGIEQICIVVTTTLASRMQVHSLRPSKTLRSIRHKVDCPSPLPCPDLGIIWL